VPTFAGAMNAQTPETEEGNCRLCDDCGHPAVQHDVDGLGPCTVTECDCPVLLPADAAEDNALETASDEAVLESELAPAGRV
jgi:hypothetical protein